MPRFFLDREQIGQRYAVLTGQQAAHAKVLRLKPGDLVTLCDGKGTDYSCVISDISTDQVCLVIEDNAPAKSEPRISVSVYMAFSKGDKLEHVIQKATELGANEIVSFPSSRCVAKMDRKTLDRKLLRWKKIASSAAEQSGRGRIPDVIAMDSFEDALNRASEADIPILFYENEKNCMLSDLLEESCFSLSLMTGPEGGFTADEIAQAMNSGMRICSLGSRILRCETAPLCALSAVMFASGEF